MDFNSDVLNAEGVVLVDFWAEWCPPCKIMLPAIDKLSQEFNIVKIDVESNNELAAEYNVSSIPLLLFFQNGEVVQRISGLVTEEAIRSEFERLI
jgi:thioredoxin 1